MMCVCILSCCMHTNLKKHAHVLRIKKKITCMHRCEAGCGRMACKQGNIHGVAYSTYTMIVQSWVQHPCAYIYARLRFALCMTYDDVWFMKQVCAAAVLRCDAAALQCCDAVRGREAAAIRRREPCIWVVTRTACLARIFPRIRLELKEQGGLLECCRSAPALSHVDVGRPSYLSWWKLEAQSSMALSGNPCRLVLHEQRRSGQNRWLES